MTITATLSPSPIEQIKVAEHSFYIKRDDLLNPHFSGNKARKFAYYLEQSFPDITHVISYGSVQANSLYSLAALAQLKGWQLQYYVSRIPSWLKGSKIGNYGQAVALGANIIEVENLPQYIDSNGNNADDFDTINNLDSKMQLYAKTLPNTALFIPEGGRSYTAQLGVNQLAKEIANYCDENTLFNIKNPIKVMLPSGTGATALFLQTWFSENNIPIEVLTCACVGDEDYLKQQFSQLNPNTSQWPTVLPTIKKYHFGKLNQTHYQLWHQLQDDTGIEFELLYDPIGWQCLLDYVSKTSNYSHKNITTTPIFYLHQGGIIGNQTMLPRYQRKYPNLIKKV